VKAVQMGITTNMIVVTDARVYSFELAPLPGAQPDMAYSIRFRYPAPASSTTADAPAWAATSCAAPR
jgi:type IV secretion system protein VirB9